MMTDSARVISCRAAVLKQVESAEDATRYPAHDRLKVPGRFCLPAKPGLYQQSGKRLRAEQ